MRRLVLVVSLTLGALVGATGRATACSCAEMDARVGLGRWDGAFVGTFAGPSVSPGDGTTTFPFDVQLVLKGRLGAHVDVIGSSDGASCGMSFSKGERTGLFLIQKDGQWSSNLCLEVDPQALIEAAGAPLASGQAAPRAGPADQGSAWPWIVGVGLAVVGVAGFVATGILRRRSR
jgi:hypothetical protein